MRGERLLAVAAPIWLAAVLAGCGTASRLTTVKATESPAATTPCVANASKVVSQPPAAESTSASLPPDLVTTLDNAAQTSFEQAAAPGAIVGVRTAQGTWTAAYGLADPTTGEPMTTDMHMRIGSVTKTFTGTAILRLAQEGKLSLTDTIDTYYPGIPNGDKITLEQLANMTSGIASYYTDEFLDRYFTQPDTIFTPDELVAYGVSASPIFEPGEMFNYSNTNTILLGKVIETVTGRPAKDAFQQLIFEPLGLNKSSLPDVSPVIPRQHPQGYTLQGSGTPGNPANATNWSPSFGWTAGGMISTVQDLLTYDRALATGQGLLRAETQIQRLRSFPEPAGYGFALGCVDGWIGHTGELPGFNTALYYDTTTDTSVVVLVNSDISSGDCAESPTLTDNQTDLPCSAPATRVFVGISEALGHKFQPLPAR